MMRELCSASSVATERSSGVSASANRPMPITATARNTILNLVRSPMNRLGRCLARAPDAGQSAKNQRGLPSRRKGMAGAAEAASLMAAWRARSRCARLEAKPQGRAGIDAMADDAGELKLETFRSEVRTWLEANFPKSLRGGAGLGELMEGGEPGGDALAWRKRM